MAIPYDVVTVGGGLAGSTLAKCLAEHGHRVLVLERETRFRDRVRGEQMHPWGVAEARTLGIYQRLSDTCGHQTRWWTTYEGPTPLRKRDLAQTTPHQVGSFNFYHPDMQEALLRVAAEAGAEVRRGVSVGAVKPGRSLSVSVREHDHAYGVVRRITNWLTELLYSTGHAADERRARVFPRLAAEPERAPDLVGLGPASPSDDAARRFVLGEDDE